MAGMAAKGGLKLVLLLGVLLLSCRGALEVEDDEEDYSHTRERSDQNVASVPLEHDLEGTGDWKPRGMLTYTGPKLVTAKSKRLALKLQKLIDNNELYRVRIQSNVNDPNSPKVMSSIPACLLVASSFHEIFRVHVDQYGNIRGLWYQTMATGCPKDLPRLGDENVRLVTSVNVDMESKGPKLAAEPVERNPEEGPDGKGGPGAKENQSMFQKYWMYMLGFIILLSVMGGDEEKKGAAPGGGGGGGGGGGPARR